MRDMLALFLLTLAAVIHGYRTNRFLISRLVGPPTTSMYVTYQGAKGDTHEVQPVPVPELRIIFIGIVGPRSSGKKKLAERLAKELQSPFKPMSSQWYFKAPADMPKYRAPGMKWDGKPNYAHPKSVRLVDMWRDMRDTFRKLNEAFTISGKLPDSVILERASGTNSTYDFEALRDLMSGRDISALPKTRDGQYLVFIVAQGLYLYRYKQLADMMQYKIWLHIDNATKMSDRHFKREFAEQHGGQPLEPEDVRDMMDFRYEFHSKYLESWFEEEATQKSNAGWRIDVDATKSVEHSFSEAQWKLEERMHFMHFRGRGSSNVTECEDENSSVTATFKSYPDE